MADDANCVDGLKSLVAVLERDDCWRIVGNRSLAQHHRLIAEYSLHPGLPVKALSRALNASADELLAVA